MTEEDEEFERIASKCKETKRVNESKWHSEMCSNYGGFCKKEWVGLTYEEESELIRLAHNHAGIRFYIQAAEAKLKEKNT